MISIHWSWKYHCWANDQVENCTGSWNQQPSYQGRWLACPHIACNRPENVWLTHMPLSYPIFAWSPQSSLYEIHAMLLCNWNKCLRCLFYQISIDIAPHGELVRIRYLVFITLFLWIQKFLKNFNFIPFYFSIIF